MPELLLPEVDDVVPPPPLVLDDELVAEDVPTPALEVPPSLGPEDPTPLVLEEPPPPTPLLLEVLASVVVDVLDVPMRGSPPASPEPGPAEEPHATGPASRRTGTRIALTSCWYSDVGRGVYQPCPAWTSCWIRRFPGCLAALDVRVASGVEET